MFLVQAARLAWSNTSDDWRRLAVRCTGITFAVVLMFMQTGFRNALFDSNVRVAENTDADIVIRTRTRFMLSSGQLMPLQKIIEARNVPGVASVHPIYFENVVSRLRKIGKPSRRIRVIAFDIQRPVFGDFGVLPFADALSVPMTAIADDKSKPMFGFNEDVCAGNGELYGELFNQKIKMVGCFRLGIDFSNDGNIIMTPENFARYFSHRGQGRPLELVDYGLATVEKGADVDRVVAAMKKSLGPHVIVNSKQDFLKSERDFWGKATPVGLIFMFGTIIGFVVGLIICYQVLSTDIADHMGEFATLKAMGYPTSFFAAVVVLQALFMSFISFLPGLLITLAIFTFVNSTSGLIMFLNFDRASLVLLLTVAMCVVSGVIALQKLLSSDPANLF